MNDDQQPAHPPTNAADDQSSPQLPPPAQAKEIGGRQQGLEPTRYGDWEKNGRCIDF